MELVLYFLMCAVATGYLVLISQKQMQILQLEGYGYKRLFKWLKSAYYSYVYRLANLAFLSTICMLVYLALFSEYKYWSYLGMLFYIAFSHIFFLQYLNEVKKKRLVYTARVKRLVVVASILFLGLVFVCTYFTKDYMVGYLFVGVLPLVSPFVLALSLIILQPIENRIRQGFITKAQTKLATRPNLTLIGITGSYGKTSVKNILCAMLNSTFKAGATRESYNTPMGICRQINDPNESLDYDFFIVEAGAKRVGDIKEICEIFPIKIGLISGIGEAHLESFLTLENIAKTKYELIEGLRDGGFSAFNCTYKPCLSLHDKLVGNKIAVSERGAGDEFYAVFGDVSYSKDGTFFTLEIEGKKQDIHTRLVGAHHASNIAFAGAVAHKLGVPLEAIAETAKLLKPIPHRLELTAPTPDLLILDDAYNSNLLGAKSALEVLSRLEGTKIVITPGIVELGKASGEVNHALGKAMRIADRVYVIGANAPYLKQGLKSEGYDMSKVFVVSTPQEAVEHAKDIEGKRAILFENDLTDNY